MQWTFEVSDPVDADLVVPAGQVEIGAGDRVEVVLEPMSDSSRAEEVIAAATVSCSGGKLKVHVPTRRFRSVDIDCRIVIPEGSRVLAKTASADIWATLRLAGFDAATASGDIRIGEVDKSVSVSSASGDFAAEQIGGKLRVKSASGDVSVRSAGGDVDIALASGDVEIGDAAKSVEVRSASGDVHVGRAHSGKVKIETASGDIEVAVAPGVGAFLDIESLSGDMSCTLPVADTSAEEATLELRCRSASGDVEIRGADK
jgi:Putative adhesin